MRFSDKVRHFFDKKKCFFDKSCKPIPHEKINQCLTDINRCLTDIFKI